MWRVTLRGLLAHRLRMLLTGVAIVLGVAFVSGTLVLTDTIRQTFDTAYATANGGTDVSVRATTPLEDTAATDRETVPASLLDVVRRAPGVANAVGTVLGYAQIGDKHGGVVSSVLPTVATSWAPPDMSALKLRS